MGKRFLIDVGSWLDCINPLSLPVHAHFFEVGSIFYSNMICPMCWNKLLKIQGYHQAGFYIDTHKKSNDCKPEIDSL